jgi:hypothetical protein
MVDQRRHADARFLVIVVCYTYLPFHWFDILKCPSLYVQHIIDNCSQSEARIVDQRCHAKFLLIVIHHATGLIPALRFCDCALALSAARFVFGIELPFRTANPPCDELYRQNCKCKELVWFGIALRPQTPKHIRGGWSHYTDTSEPVDGNGAQNMVTIQSGFEPATFQSLAHELTNCSNQTHM